LLLLYKFEVDTTSFNYTETLKVTSFVGQDEIDAKSYRALNGSIKGFRNEAKPRHFQMSQSSDLT
jgi:hypothetical protein